MHRQPLSQRSENTMDGGEALMAKVKQAASDQGVREMKEVRGAFGRESFMITLAALLGLPICCAMY